MNKKGQISRKELIEETQQVLKDSNVENKIKSKYANEVSKEICGIKDPVFARMQPKIKPKTSQNWLEAYYFVMAFLKENKAENTIDCIIRELNTCNVQIALNRRPSYKFNDLKNTKRASFKDSVKEFTEKLESQEDSEPIKAKTSPILQESREEYQSPMRQSIEGPLFPQKQTYDDQEEDFSDIEIQDDFEEVDDNNNKVDNDFDNDDEEEDDDVFTFSDDAFNVETNAPQQQNNPPGFDVDSFGFSSTDPFAASGSFV